MGLPAEMLDSVVKCCEFLSGSCDVEERHLVWNWATEIVLPFIWCSILAAFHILS